MPNSRDLPYLIQLLDDDSEVVRSAVSEELDAFGDALEGELGGLQCPPTDSQRDAIQQVVREGRRRWMHIAWRNWSATAGNTESLEDALWLVAQFQDGRGRSPSLGALLDGLAQDFRGNGASITAEGLAEYLFVERGLRGALNDYRDPWNSNLAHVIEEKKGLPISLACIYILVGDRMGLPIDGCDWPGHFYARIRRGKRIMLVDCYNGGNLIEEDTFLSLQGPSRAAARTVVRQDTDADAIAARVLRNLASAYRHAGMDEDARLMKTLLGEADARGQEDGAGPLPF